MKVARASRWALTCALVACAGPTTEAEAPKAPPDAAAPATAIPLSPERQRLEAWKEGQASVDPRGDFARAAEAEAEQRRSEALARNTPAGTDAIEAEMRAHQMEELASWTGGCFAEEPDFSVQEDLIRHRKLTRDDFRDPEEDTDVESAIDMPGAVTEAYVAIRLACVVRTKVRENGSGAFTAELETVRFFSLLSRDRSWWNPEAPTNPEWILRHEQLHFDVAELFAEEQNANVARVRDETREARDDPEAAAYALRAHLATYLEAQQRNFEAVETQYDRETLHGNDFERQTEWFARVRRGLGAVRAGLAVEPTLRSEQD